jgi:hypothetical protein
MPVKLLYPVVPPVSQIHRAIRSYGNSVGPDKLPIPSSSPSPFGDKVSTGVKLLNPITIRIVIPLRHIKRTIGPRGQIVNLDKLAIVTAKTTNLSYKVPVTIKLMDAIIKITGTIRVHYIY